MLSMLMLFPTNKVDGMHLIYYTEKKIIIIIFIILISFYHL